MKDRALSQRNGSRNGKASSHPYPEASTSTSDDTPISAAVVTSSSIAPVLIAAAIGDDHEVAAATSLAPVLARRNDVPMMTAVIPIVASPDISVEALTIGPIGVRTIIAVDIARDHIARKPSQYESPDHRTPATMAHCTANNATGNGSKNRTLDPIVVMAVVRDRAR